MQTNGMYALKYPDGQFVHVGTNDTGYPHPTTDLRNVHLWETAEEADQYRQIGGNRHDLTIHKITGLVTKPVREEQRTVTALVDPDQ